jgi:hypothetical protein
MTVIINEWMNPIIIVPNTARNCYLNSIKIILFVLEVGTQLFQRSDGSDLLLVLSQPSSERSE